MTDAARGAEELAGILRRGGKLKHDLLVGADLRQADLSGARLDQLDLSGARLDGANRSEEHTSELQSLMRISYAVFCLKKKRAAIKRNNIDTDYDARNELDNWRPYRR